MEFTIGQYNDNGNYMLHLEKNPVICNIAVVHHRKSSEYEFNNTGNFYNEIKSYWNIGKKIIDDFSAVLRPVFRRRKTEAFRY